MLLSLDSLTIIHQYLAQGRVQSWSQNVLMVALQEARPHTDEEVQATSTPGWKSHFFAYLHASTRITEDTAGEGTALVAVREVTRFFQVEAGELFLWDRDSGELTCRAAVAPPEWLPSADEQKSFSLAAYPAFLPVLEKAQVLRVHLASRGEPPISLPAGNELRTLYLFPLVASQQVIGLVQVMDARQELAICDERLALAQMLLNGAAVSLRSAHQLEKMKRRAAIFELICGSVRDLSINLEVQNVLDTSLDAVLDLFAELDSELRQALIFLQQDGRLNFRAGIRVEGSTRQPLAEHSIDELAYRAASQLAPARSVLGGPYGSQQAALHHPYGSAIALPLAGQGGLLGVLSLSSVQPDAFGQAHLELLYRLCDHIVIAIENAHRYAVLSEQALTDALTGLPNRRALDIRLEQEVRRAGRYRHPLTLFMIDLNEFKDINDTFGHPYGDGVLQQVAACLRQNLRDTDFIARFGGDEFVVIMPETDHQTAAGLAQRLQDAIASSEIYPEIAEARSASLSLGMAVFPDHAITARSLLVAADKALYRAKAQARPVDRR